MTHSPVAALVIALWAASAAARAGEAGPTIDEIRVGINRQWENIRSLELDYQKSQELVEQPEVVKKFTLIDAIMKKEESFAFKGDKRYYKSDGPSSAKDIAPATDHDYDVIPRGKEIAKRVAMHNAKALGPNFRLPLRRDVHNFIATRELAYDGERMVQAQSNKMTEIQNPEQVRQFSASFADGYLENILRALPNPIDRKDDRKLLRVPDIFDLGGFTVQAGLQDVDGQPCVVVARLGRETIWLDPKINYGVRRCELLFDGTPYVMWRRFNRGWKEFAPGVWLPTVATKEECGPPLAPESYRGKPLYRTVYTLKTAKINDVPDSSFVIRFEPGVTVLDATRLPLKNGEKQFLVYKMPAHPSQIERAVAAALADRAVRHWVLGIPTVLLVVSGILIAMIGMVIFLRVRGQRNRSTH